MIGDWGAGEEGGRGVGGKEDEEWNFWDSVGDVGQWMYKLVGTNGEERIDRGFVLEADLGIVLDDKLEEGGFSGERVCMEVNFSSTWLTLVNSSHKICISFFTVLISLVRVMLSLSNNSFWLLRVWLAFIVTWNSLLRSW